MATKPLIVAYTILRDGERLDFPWRESIESYALVADVVLVYEGGSTDDTARELDALASRLGNVVVCNSDPWEPDVHMAVHKNRARDLCPDSRYLLYFDVDEVFHEDTIGHVRSACRLSMHCERLYLSPMLHHFDDRRVLKKDSGFYPSAVRLTSGNRKFRHIGDGWSIGDPTGKVKAILSGLFTVYHYQFWRGASAYAQKKHEQSIRHGATHPTYDGPIVSATEYMAVNGIMPEAALEEFTGAHPAVMEPRRARLYGDHHAR